MGLDPLPPSPCVHLNLTPLPLRVDVINGWRLSIQLHISAVCETGIFRKTPVLCCKKAFNICWMYGRLMRKDPMWPSGLVARSPRRRSGFNSRSVGLSEINFSDLYCGWLGRNINVE